MLTPLLASFDVTVVTVGLPALIVSICGMLVAAYLVLLISKAPKGNEKVQEISQAISIGAKTFLRLEYTALAIAAAALYILVSAAVNWQTGICYLFGAITSATCGFIGMMIATYSNGRTAAAAEQGLDKALRVSFNSGSVMGLTVVSVGLGTISVLLMAFGVEAVDQAHGHLAGFGMGASTVSIFSRVGGGIFTKAADVGADLVGKIEKDIPEDDVRNPATIADNVGDNVGDVAGMGADLYSSFVGSCIASSLLGVSQNAAFTPADKILEFVALPYWICMSGIVAAIIGIWTVRCKDNATQRDLLIVLRRGMFVAGFFQVGFMALIIGVLDLSWKLFGCLIIGLAAGITISILSELFTSFAYLPTQSIAQSARIGPANVVIQGLAVGMYACIGPALIITAVILAVLDLANVYGIALASSGLLSTLGITLATDAYGPVADNAGGIAEMAHMPEQTRRNTDVLDALGNTTAAVGKGFAVGSAVLTAVSLLTTYATRVGLRSANFHPINSDRFIPGLILGAMLPYWFSAMCMQSVNKAAQCVVIEVRRQFDEIAGLMEGTAKPDYAACVSMITWASLHAMLFPVLLTVLAPIIVGVGLGPEMLAGLLLGVITSGFMLGYMKGTAGGAWDNAKKYIEAGHFGGKKSAAHKAAVVGDTIGDPFKDTSGPAINIQMKLTSYISVTLSTVFKAKNQGGTDGYWWAALIILGVLAVFVPIWQRVAPEGLDLQKLEAKLHHDHDAHANHGNKNAEVAIQLQPLSSSDSRQNSNETAVLNGGANPSDTSSRAPTTSIDVHEPINSE